MDFRRRVKCLALDKDMVKILNYLKVKDHGVLKVKEDDGLFEVKGKVWNGKRIIRNYLKEIDEDLSVDIQLNKEREGLKDRSISEESMHRFL